MLKIMPIHLKPACEFVGEHHRHNIPPVGGKFAVAYLDMLCNFIVIEAMCLYLSGDLDRLEGGAENG